jgi:hypothetical protein
MNQPLQTRPSAIPLLAWLEENKLVSKGTGQKVSQMAMNAGKLLDALKAAGVIR